MKSLLLRGSALAVLPLALSACGGNGSSVPTPTPTTPVTPPTVTFQSQFGTQFAAAFNASPTGTPIDPAATDVPALNATAAPLDN